MSGQSNPSVQHRRRARLLAIMSFSIAAVAISIAIGAIVTAHRAVEKADRAIEIADNAERAMERQRRASGAGSSSTRRLDPRADFLASTADRRDLLDEGLEQWGAMYSQHQHANASVQYRAFTDFFDSYPLVSEYFFFVGREQPLLAFEDQVLHEAFRYWLDLRQAMSS